MTKSKKHSLVINVTFDKPCSKRAAQAQVKDCIHGVFYPAVPWGYDHPEEFSVKSFRQLRKDEK